MREHIEKLEENVSAKILNLKELKETFNEAERQKINTAEQLQKLTRTGR